MGSCRMGEAEETQAPEPTRKSCDWLFWLLVIVLIASLAVIIPPMFIRNGRPAYQTEAVNNLRQIGLAIFEFETEYGDYPNDKTATLVTKKHPGHGHNLSGNSSNALFRQLFAARLTQSEQMFYAKVSGTRKPDGVISPGEALEKGEVAFGYISGLSSEGNPARPIAFCPIIPGTDRFDPKPFKGKACVIRGDGSVISLNIGKNGHAFVGGINLLSAENPIWGDEDKIDIRYPDL